MNPLGDGRNFRSWDLVREEVSCWSVSLEGRGKKKQREELEITRNEAGMEEEKKEKEARTTS